MIPKHTKTYKIYDSSCLWKHRKETRVGRHRQYSIILSVELFIFKFWKNKLILYVEYLLYHLPFPVLLKYIFLKLSERFSFSLSKTLTLNNLSPFLHLGRSIWQEYMKQDHRTTTAKLFTTSWLRPSTRGVSSISWRRRHTGVPFIHGEYVPIPPGDASNCG